MNTIKKVMMTLFVPRIGHSEPRDAQAAERAKVATSTSR